MSSLKYLGRVSLAVLLSTPISAHFHHMDMYRDIGSDTTANPILKKSFYLKVERRGAFRGLPECMADITVKPSLQSCSKTHPLPFSTELFEETVRTIENYEFGNSPVESQSKTSLLSFGSTEQLKTEDMAYKSVKSRIESWSKKGSLSLAFTKPVETVKLEAGMASESVKSRIEFWSKTRPLLTPPQSVETIVVDEVKASESVSLPLDSHSNASPVTLVPAKSVEVEIREDAKELAEEMARILRLGVHTSTALMISMQVDEKCKPKKLRRVDLLKAGLFRRAFLVWSQKHLAEIYAERGKKWRIISPSLDSLFLN